MITKLESTFDLDCSSCPRSLAAYPLSDSNHSPETPTNNTNSSPSFAMVYGTERGSLHYRTFPLLARPGDSTKTASSNVTVDWAGTPGGQIQTGAIIGCIPAWTDKNLFLNTSNAFLILRDDNRGAGAAHSSNPGAYASSLVVLQHDTFTGLTTVPHHAPTSTTATSFGTLPRMTCASYHPDAGFVYAAGTSVCSLSPLVMYSVAMTLVQSSTSTSSPAAYIASSGMAKTSSNLLSMLPNFYFHLKNILPPPGARSTGSGCAEALSLICQGRVAILPVGNSFWAVPGKPIPSRLYQIWKNMSMANFSTSEVASLSSWDIFQSDETVRTNTEDAEKILTFHQSSQIHPTIAVEIPTAKGKEIVTANAKNKVGDIIASLLFLASGKECAALEIFYNPNFSTGTVQEKRASKKQLDEELDDHESTTSKGLVGGSILLGPPRHGIISMSSPILSAIGLPWHDTTDGLSQSTNPMVAILTADGVVDLRSFSCMAVPLFTLQIGARPNDFFEIRALSAQRVLALSYSGQASLVSARLDSIQDLADRLMKLCIDAFGINGFPRTLLAEAMNTSFSSTTYVGAEATIASKNCLKQYLESILGLDVNDDYGPALIRSATQMTGSHTYNSFLLPATGILCLVCAQISPPNAALAVRAAKACAQQMGVTSSMRNKGVHDSVVKFVYQVVESLLREATNFVLLTPSSSTALNTNMRSSKTGLNMDLTESALWLLRACGDHQRAIEVLQDYMTNPSLRNKATGSLASVSGQVSWAQGKFETYLMSHLSDLWRSNDEECTRLVLTTLATRQLLENNPKMGLNIFTSHLPQNKQQWELVMKSKQALPNTPLCSQVVELLKSIRPRIIISSTMDCATNHVTNENFELPIDSGLALAVTYLEAVIGLSTGRSKVLVINTNEVDEQLRVLESDLHDQLAFLLLEGIIAERTADSKEPDSMFGLCYRKKLHRLFKWPNATLRSERLITVLPSSFLQERALLLGRLGRHKEALEILYCNLKNLEMALEYCDMRYEQIKIEVNHQDNPYNSHSLDESACPYMPLVQVVLGSDPDPKRGITAAINILSLRRNVINLTTALRLLPADLPISTVAEPFLIPSLIENESEVRRLTMISSLMRAKYMSLKRKLIDHQILSQMDIDCVPMIQTLNLGDPFNIAQPFHLKPINDTKYCPEVIITKYFYPRYLILKAEIVNSLQDQPLGDIVFTVAESLDEAFIPSFNIPIKTLPSSTTGVAWCILNTYPQRIDEKSSLSSELRYTILDCDPVSGAPLYFGSDYGALEMGQLRVVEMEDMEIHFYQM